MKKILSATAIVVTLYSSAWYALTNRLQQQSEHFLTAHNDKSTHTKIAFSQTEKFGFPFRIGVRFKIYISPHPLEIFTSKQIQKGQHGIFQQPFLPKPIQSAQRTEMKFLCQQQTNPF